MRQDTAASFEPRKSPVQARSAATVEAIQEATIQVLLNGGAERLTTTRVAARAGASVGTLYQYYPNKQALLFAVLERHLSNVSGAVEAACEHSRGKPLAQLAKHVVEAFVDAKMRRTDVSQALYLIAAGIDGPALVRRASLRSRKAMETAMRSAPDAANAPEAFMVQIMFGAMAGATKSVLEAGASPAMVRKLRHHLVLLCQSYLEAGTHLTSPARQGP